MADRPDLTTEPDTADTIVKVEWGVRWEAGVDVYGSSPRSERLARMDAASGQEVAVRRTVTYGPWAEAGETDG